jgi:hypothetical protein
MLQDDPEGKKTFLLKLLDRLLQGAMAPSPKEMSQMAGSKLWQSYGKRLMTSSLFLGMAFQALGEMMLRNEGWMSESIAAITCHFPFIKLLQIMEWCGDSICSPPRILAYTRFTCTYPLYKRVCNPE